MMMTAMIDETRLRGNFALFLHKRGRAWLLNDDVQLDLAYSAGLNRRTPDHAVTGDLGDEFREQTDDVNAHGVGSVHQKSASQSTMILPLSKSSDFT